MQPVRHSLNLSLRSCRKENKDRGRGCRSRRKIVRAGKGCCYQSEYSNWLQAIRAIENSFGKGTVMKLGDAADRAQVSVISTGSVGLDMALGIGHFPAFLLLISRRRASSWEGCGNIWSWFVSGLLLAEHCREFRQNNACTAGHCRGT